MTGYLIGYVTAGGIEHEGEIYSFNRLYDWNDEPEQTLFALSSWVRQDIKDFIGRKVIFSVNNVYGAYNIGILDEHDNIIKL